MALAIVANVVVVAGAGAVAVSEAVVGEAVRFVRLWFGIDQSVNYIQRLQHSMK